MTLANILCSATYLGDGQTTQFAVPFRFFDDEIAVYFNKSNQKYLKGTDYTVTGSGELNGGAVIFNTAPAQGIYVTIVRDVPLNQEIVFMEGEDFPARDYEYSLDRLYMALQEMHEKLKRAFLAVPGTDGPADSYYAKTEVYNKTEVEEKLDNYYAKTEVETKLDNYYTKPEIDEILGDVEQLLSEV